MEHDKRLAYKVKENGEKESISFKNIKKGMLIELYEDENERLEFSNGKYQFRAESDAYITEEGIYSFNYILDEE